MYINPVLTITLTGRHYYYYLHATDEKLVPKTSSNLHGHTANKWQLAAGWQAPESLASPTYKPN